MEAKLEYLTRNRLARRILQLLCCGALLLGQRTDLSPYIQPPELKA